jgi:hypothetical protein
VVPAAIALCRETLKPYVCLLSSINGGDWQRFCRVPRAMPQWGNGAQFDKARRRAAGTWLATALSPFDTDFPMAMAGGMLMAMSLSIRRRHASAEL